MKIINAVFNAIDWGRIQVTIELEDNSKETIFSYYMDEIEILHNGIIGLTVNEARAVFLQKTKDHLLL